jgi:hypothetical protein
MILLHKNNRKYQNNNIRTIYITCMQKKKSMKKTACLKQKKGGTKIRKIIKPSRFALPSTPGRTKRVRRQIKYTKKNRKGGRVLIDSEAAKIYKDFVEPIGTEISKLESEIRDINEHVRLKEYEKQDILENEIQTHVQTINGLFIKALNKIKERITEKIENRKGYSQYIGFGKYIITTGIIDIFATILWVRDKYNHIINIYNQNTHLKKITGENHSDYDTEPETDSDEEEFGSTMYSTLPKDDEDNTKPPTEYDDLVNQIQILIASKWPTLGVIKPRNPKNL